MQTPPWRAPLSPLYHLTMAKVLLMNMNHGTYEHVVMKPFVSTPSVFTFRQSAKPNEWTSLHVIHILYRSRNCKPDAERRNQNKSRHSHNHRKERSLDLSELFSHAIVLQNKELFLKTGHTRNTSNYFENIIFMILHHANIALICVKNHFSARSRSICPVPGAIKLNGIL